VGREARVEEWLAAAFSERAQHAVDVQQQ